jgi:hypothetical protein
MWPADPLGGLVKGASTVNMEEFVEMLHAIAEDRPFEVGFQLQHNSDDGPTLQSLCGDSGERPLAEFFDRVLAADPPRYVEEPR